MSHPETGEIRMTAEQIAPRLIGRLVEIEARSTSVAVARGKVARRIGMTPNAVEDVQRGRIKSIRWTIVERIRAAFVAALTDEITAAQDEIRMALQAGIGPDEDQVAALEAAMAEGKALVQALKGKADA